MSTDIDFARLREPFAAEDIEWRIQQGGVKAGNAWAMVLAYVTARAIQDRLDEVVGPDRWRNEFSTGPDGGVLCGLAIRVNGEWVTKYDGAENTHVEAVKGGLSGALKRAAVQWGIGRYLYNLEEGWAKIHDGGKLRGQVKDGSSTKYIKWDPPALPGWALPGGSGKPGPGKPGPQLNPAPAPGDTSTPPAMPHGARKTSPPGRQADVPACPKCGGAMWDNRPKKAAGQMKPNAPDAKCKKGCDGGVIWDISKHLATNEPIEPEFTGGFDPNDDVPF